MLSKTMNKCVRNATLGHWFNHHRCSDPSAIFYLLKPKSDTMLPRT